MSRQAHTMALVGAITMAVCFSILRWKSRDTVRTLSIRDLIRMYGSSPGGEEAASSELTRRGAVARNEIIQVLDAIEKPDLQPKEVRTIVRILEFVLPSEESYSALGRCRSRIADPIWREGLASPLATIRARLSGQEDDAWRKLHRAMSPAEQYLHSVELKLAGATPADRLPFLVNAAKAASRAGDEVKADAYAREVLSTPDLPSKSGDGVFHANDVLGMLALKRGDIANAKRYMIESAKTPGLTRGGPSFRLAEALLSRGERDAVLEYLDLCKGFLRHQDLIEAWRVSIRSGGTPRFQDWGDANQRDALR
jgi:hypothetical protein